jgi:hypothetical protein
MPVVGGMTMSVVHIVGVVVMRDGNMPTAGAVRVVVSGVRDVLCRGTFIDMAFVDDVKMSVVHVVDVFSVRDGDMAATISVGVAVVAMLYVSRGH